MHRPAETDTKISSLAQLVARQAKATGLIKSGQRILVSVSGGPDSVALLAVLNELAPALRLTLHAAHINYGLRGEESEEDARFVARLCDRFGIALHDARVDIAQRGITDRRSSIQERAREVRYLVLERQCLTVGADRIALGHQADDQAETLLMWMLRGAGTSGMAGIPPIREDLFIRPLLGISRDTILAYLQSRGLPFRLDSSNATSIYRRNQIRHELLPALKRFNPSVVAGLARQADILREENAYLHQLACDAAARLAQSSDQGVLVDRTGLLALPLTLQRRVLRILVQRLHPRGKGPGFTTIASLLEKVFQGRSGASLAMQGVHASREYATVRFQPKASARRTEEPDRDMPQALILPVPASLIWPLTGQLIQTRLGPPFLSGGKPTSRSLVHLDFDRMSMPLTLRSWRPGDAFQPAGMGGRSKKLQDFFSDIKLPRR
ncbi:MAG: tRNA lysidine(34) synthetase TilS, partial [Nitrospiraceae bacterium]